jgi:rare lipoprotein A
MHKIARVASIALCTAGLVSLDPVLASGSRTTTEVNREGMAAPNPSVAGDRRIVSELEFTPLEVREVASPADEAASQPTEAVAVPFYSVAPTYSFIVMDVGIVAPEKAAKPIAIPERPTAVVPPTADPGFGSDPVQMFVPQGFGTPIVPFVAGMEAPATTTTPTTAPSEVPTIVPPVEPLPDITPRRESPAPPVERQVLSTQMGKASWYGTEAGTQTASGERYRGDLLTAAHRTLPFGSQVRVTNLHNGRSTIVRINDRGPFIRGRIVDLSSAAASEIDMKRSGIVDVRLEVLSYGNNRRQR